MANQTQSVSISQGKGTNGRGTKETHLNLEDQHGRKRKGKTHPLTCQPTLRLPSSRPR